MTRDVPLFVAIAEYATRHGAQSIKDLPGCWEVQIDARWWIAVNGHDVPTPCSRGGEPVPPWSAYIEFNGWPAGLISARDGGCLAAGELANEATFRAALAAA